MEWNVYRENFNTSKIETVNVFDHTRFMDEVLEIKRRKLSIEEFSEELKHIAMYYFWAKCEHEVVITSFPPYISKEELDRLNNEDGIYKHYPRLETGKKIDVYQQLVLNWDRFVEYVYNFGE